MNTPLALLIGALVAALVAFAVVMPARALDGRGLGTPTALAAASSREDRRAFTALQAQLGLRLVEASPWVRDELAAERQAPEVVTATRSRPRRAYELAGATWRG